MKYSTFLSKFLTLTMKNSMPITAPISFVLQTRFSNDPHYTNPLLPLQFRHISVWIHQWNWQQYTAESRQVRQSHRSEQHPYLPSIKTTKGWETFSFTGHTSQTAKKKINIFPDLHIIKESEEKPSLRTGSSWFGDFLRNIKNRSLKLYLLRPTIFPLRICSKTLKTQHYLQLDCHISEHQIAKLSKDFI